MGRFAFGILVISILLSPTKVVHAQEPASDPSTPPHENSEASANARAQNAGESVSHTAWPTEFKNICRAIEAAARAQGLPFGFFARLIWQESRFRHDAVGPVTRSGLRAEGIAQFMPYTAAERLLLDPFDPAQALPKSAEFLKELLAEFGNLGFAAAAYNAGPQRVRDWIA